MLFLFLNLLNIITNIINDKKANNLEKNKFLKNIKTKEIIIPKSEKRVILFIIKFYPLKNK